MQIHGDVESHRKRKESATKNAGKSPVAIFQTGKHQNPPIKLLPH
jgi:hypothetical protein